jgi:CheY-like chemotaxis protein
MNVVDRPGWRILVVEDEGLIAMFISDTLNEMGHLVIGPVRTIGDALTMIDEEMIDMALLDINLGAGKTSYPIAEMLRRRNVPFAFLTGYGRGGVSGDFLDRPVISKPIDQRYLAETLRQLGSTPTHSGRRRIGPASGDD